MQKTILITGLLAFILTVNANNNAVTSERKEQAKNLQAFNSSARFLENQGQFLDDQGRPVPFVLFKVQQPGVDIYITEKGITYAFVKSDEDGDAEEGPKTRNQEMELTYCRADMDLQGAHISRQQITYGDTAVGVNNYFLPQCPKGIMNVHSYKNLVIHNIYPGIDWQWSVKGNSIEQDFIVQPGADAGHIKMQYHWADMALAGDGHELNIATPLGLIKEGRTISYNGNSEIDTRYNLNADKQVNFNVAAYDHSQVLRIDPPMQLVWGTYFQGNGPDGLWAVCTDALQNVYSAGESEVTSYPTLSSGAGAYFQTTSTGGWDVNICKFGSNNGLVWCTLYGGSSSEQVLGGLDVDAAGNLYMTNCTQSTNLPLMNYGGGSYYSGTLNGVQDAFISRFGPNGALVWATYFGGTSTGAYESGEDGTDLKVKNGKVYLTGMTDDTGNFPLYNPGGGAYYQATHVAGKTAFIAVFDTGGVQLWTTYLGGSTGDEGWAINLDTAENIFVCGRTNSTNFPTLNPGNGSYFQGTNAGGYDGFIAKFSPQFAMLYSSYWGGSGDDVICNVSCTDTNTYIAGVTASTNLPITNPGGGTYYQSSGGLFINRFDHTFNSAWGTYYGGSQFWQWAGNFNAKSMAVDAAGDAIMVGYLLSPYYNPGGSAYYNTVAGGGLVAFNNANQQIWATALGSAQGSWANGICFNSAGDIYVVGEMQGAPISIYNPGGVAYFDSTIGTGDNGFITRFGAIAAQTVSATVNAISGCTTCSGVASVNAQNGTPPYSFLWSTTATTDTITSLCPGTYYVTVTDNMSNTVIDSVTVLAPVLPQVQLGNDTSVCNGGSLIIDAGNPGSSYIWSNSGTLQTVTITQSGTYSVTVTSNTGCTASGTININIGNDSIAVSGVNAGCANNSGSATVNVITGSGPYIYLWSNNGNTDSISGLSAGTYIITVTASGNCTATASVTIDSFAIAPVSITSADSVVCPGDSMQICAPAGYSSYLWNNSQTSYCIYATQAGNYYVMVTDSNNCTASSNHLPANFYVTNPVSVTVNGDTLIAYDGTTYQWYENGNLIAGATSAQYLATGPGFYTVVITDEHGCAISSNPINLTGISNILNESFKVYPNPTNGFWNLETDENMLGAKIEIFDATGRLTYSGIIETRKSVLKANCASGMYLLRITSANLSTNIKLTHL